MSFFLGVVVTELK